MSNPYEGLEEALRRRHRAVFTVAALSAGSVFGFASFALSEYRLYSVSEKQQETAARLDSLTRLVSGSIYWRSEDWQRYCALLPKTEQQLPATVPCAETEK